MTFSGFPEDSPNPIRIPEQFFRQVLPGIAKLDELKLTLYIFWRLQRMEGAFRFLRFSQLIHDEVLLRVLADDTEKGRTTLQTALRRAIKHGIVLQAEVEDGQDKIICLNSPKGRAIIAAIERGEWRGATGSALPEELYVERPNIFQLYEANIGPLTPLIADTLRDAEKTYQANWVEDAFRIAVERNRRNWHYIEAILRRWQEGGRDDRKDQPDRRDAEEARRRYAQYEKRNTG